MLFIIFAISAAGCTANLVAVSNPNDYMDTSETPNDVELVKVFPLLWDRTEAEKNEIRDQFVRLAKPTKKVMLVSGNGYDCKSKWVYYQGPGKFLCYCRDAKRAPK